MERLREPSVKEVRLSTDEVQAILQRLRGPDEASGTTIADLAEATGTPPNQISELLALVRREGAARLANAVAVRLANAVAVRKRSRLRGATLAALALIASVALLNVPFFRGPLATMESTSIHRVIDSYGKGVPGAKVVVQLRTHPRTLLGRLVGTGDIYHAAMPTLFAPEGEIESVQAGDGLDHPIHPDEFTLRENGEYETTYEYPDVPATRRATHLRSRVRVDGQTVDIDIPLRSSR